MISINITIEQDTTGVYVFIGYFSQRFCTSTLTQNSALNVLNEPTGLLLHLNDQA